MFLRQSVLFVRHRFMSELVEALKINLRLFVYEKNIETASLRLY